MKNLIHNDTASADHSPDFGVVEVLFYGDAPSVRVEEDLTHSVHISFSEGVVVSLTPAAADALQDLLYTALVEVSA
jgi:hypothetical protein